MHNMMTIANNIMNFQSTMFHTLNTYNYICQYSSIKLGEIIR